MDEGGFVWAINRWTDGEDVRELLTSARQLESHLSACQRHPAQLMIFRFHPDTWTERELDLDDPHPRWLQGGWADCLCLYLTTEENVWISYLREPGDDGVMLFNPARDERPVEILTREDGRTNEVGLAGWHTVTGAEALPVAWEFVTGGRLPEAPEGSWWIDQDEERIELEELWAEQEKAWTEQRRRFFAELTAVNERAAEYSGEFASGERVCPLCRASGAVRYHDGAPLKYSAFSCDACERSFAVLDVDRTPQSRVE